MSVLHLDTGLPVTSVCGPTRTIRAINITLHLRAEDTSDSTQTPWTSYVSNENGGNRRGVPMRYVAGTEGVA